MKDFSKIYQSGALTDTKSKKRQNFIKSNKFLDQIRNKLSNYDN